MQIVIDIPEDHKRIIDNLVIDGKEYLLPYEVVNTLAKAVKIGTPLPKEHGRLIDADALECDYFSRIADDYAFQIIDNAPTIIEAERGDEE